MAQPRAERLMNLHILLLGAKRFIVSNPTVWRLHGTRLQAAIGGTDPILISDGERFKTLQSVSRIYEALIRAGSATMVARARASALPVVHSASARS